MPFNRNREAIVLGQDDSRFESVQWSSNENENPTETPALTPGYISNAQSVSEMGEPEFVKLTFGVHWNAKSYPAWTGLQTPKDSVNPDTLPSTPSVLMSFQDGALNGQEAELRQLKYAAPFDIEFITALIDQIRDALGFQFDVSVNVFELLMSQLDSRASRSSPKAALRSLHNDYISGSQANFRKWYFAAQIDQVDRNHIHSRESVDPSQVQRDSGDAYSPNSPKVNPNSIEDEMIHSEPDGVEPISLAEAEAIWEFQNGTSSDAERVVDIIIYLLCWSEANQMRFMPECLAFLVKCCRDYYKCNFPPHPKADRDVQNLEQGFFLDRVITPLYECYRSYNYCCTKDGDWIRREGDHKDFIGYDDMNQLFWFRDGIDRLKFERKCTSVEGLHYSEEQSILEVHPSEWYLKLPDIIWTQAFSKTYRESRSWLHNLTNFSRIWTLHAAVFWFYTAFNTPALYTPGYNYMKPEPPQEFVRFTIISLGGLIGPINSLLGLIGEYRFVPREFAGAKPLLLRILAVSFMLLILLVPAVCNLSLNPWDAVESDIMPATVIAGVLFSLAILYTIYFSFQPLDALLGSFKVGVASQEIDEHERKFLANKYFTANLAEPNKSDAILSWTMCLAIFLAKFVESYFFLTLSIRDPIREVGIMSLEDQCLGDSFITGRAMCIIYPKVILVGIILTDLTLFFLDTYLWYVIFTALISMMIAFKEGTSIWSPWRNVYSRLPQRISTKLLAPSTNAKPEHAKTFALRVIWNSIVDSMYRNSILSREQATRLIYLNVTTQEPRFFTMEEDGRALGRASEMSSTHRRISFFAQSLSTPMQPAVAVHEMPAFTVLVPHYKEKLVLKLRETINTDTSAKITILEYLQRLYPQDWDNFVEELQRQKKSSLNEECRSSPDFESEGFSPLKMTSTRSSNSESHRIALQKLGFSSLDPNDTERTRLWCSQRAQTLYRTVKGFSNYSEALRVLSCAEDSAYQSVDFCSSDDAMRELLNLCSRKFRLLVAMQLYSEFSTDELNEVETIFTSIPEMTVSYVEKDPNDGAYYSCVFDNSCPMLESGRRKPKLRIKLSGNPTLGDGKSDNQNNALPFYRGEYIQLVDANQDNYLEECLKIRNVLMEFEVPSGSSNSSASTKTPILSVRDLEVNDVKMRINSFSPVPLLVSDQAPVAIVGAREYIFSENIGILGDVAAGKEQTFGTLFSRTLAKVGAKLHYGHPDFLNAIFMTTRGGVSKGQRGLHLNEDIYAGMAALLRGGRIRHSEYFQCGKGRDLGFVSILNFDSKIGAGMGEQMLSREYFYMGTQLSFDRFISFFYAHPGFHLNNVFIVMSLEMLMASLLWITSIATVSTTCEYDKRNPFTLQHSPDGCVNLMPLIEWIKRCVLSIFLVFLLSLCPLFLQELSEKGILKSLWRISRHFASLSMIFEIFASKVYARSFWEDMSLGGAKYVATGRGMATSRVPFHSLYSGYCSEIRSGMRYAATLLFASIALWNTSFLWFWMTSFALCFSPALYNPHQFAYEEFFLDYSDTLHWFWNVTGPSLRVSGASWAAFNRTSREKLTGTKRRQKLAEGSRPNFRNSFIFEVGVATLAALGLTVPYVFVSTQKSQKSQSEFETNALLRLLLVTLIPVAANISIVATFFVLSIMLHLGGCTQYAKTLAMTVHTLSLLSLIMSWWILYIFENQTFLSTLLGASAVYGLHMLLGTILTVFVVRRQRSKAKTNDPWWTGDWRSASLGWKAPLVMVEEFIVKAVIEPFDYCYDFLTCHAILAVQVPFLIVPGIDKLHTLFLMWLRPSVTAAAHRTAILNRKRATRRIARCFSLVFLAIEGLLGFIILLPLTIPERMLNTVELKLNPLVSR